MYELLKEFIKPELIILVPVIYLIGVALKKTEGILDKDIPWLIGVISIFICILYITATEPITTYQEQSLAVFTGITQGVLIAGASVYVNQTIKQYNKEE